MLPRKLAIKVYFILAPQLTSTSELPGETATRKLRFFKNTQNTSKYHLVRAEPPITVKTIDWVHQTGPRKGA